MPEPIHRLYECGCCECYHPWDWDGDCREDAQRYGSPEEYAEAIGVSAFEVEVLSAEERAAADVNGAV